MTIKPQIIFEIYINSAWENISADVINNQDCYYGINGNKKTDRVADVGTLDFILRNDSSCLGGKEGFYTPNSTYAKGGWKKGIPIRLRIIYGGISHTKFTGHIDSITPNIEDKTVKISVLDWMDYAGNFPLNLITLSTNKKISEVVESIVSGMANKPVATDYKVGSDTFTSIFDTVKENTKAVSEFNKLALSEFGYIYVKGDGTLVVEGRNSRRASAVIKSIPASISFLLKEAGGFILQENGDKVLLDSSQPATFTNNMISLGLVYGENLVNKIVAKSYPRKIDTTLQVLFSINTPIELNPSEVKVLTVQYKDPNQLSNSVTGKDMVNPVATTDYLMNSLSNGTGTNLTSSLTVSAVYSSSEITYTLTNIGATKGYITKLQARGYGIYTYASINYAIEDTTSISENGYAELSIDQKYQTSMTTSKTIADIILKQGKTPKVVVNSINFLANTDDFLMSAFLYCDVGDLIYIKDSKSFTDSYFFIQGVKFKIKQGGLINFSWLVTDALSLEEDYWILGISKLGSESVLGY